MSRCDIGNDEFVPFRRLQALGSRAKVTRLTK